MLQIVQLATLPQNNIKEKVRENRLPLTRTMAKRSNSLGAVIGTAPL